MDATMVTWVGMLFPPRFTVLDLLEECGAGPGAGTRPPETVSSLLLPSERTSKVRSGRKQEIYRSALVEVQRTEDSRRRKQLVERIIRKQDGTPETSSGDAERRGGAFERSPGREDEEACIWNEQDLASLRWAARKAEQDRRSLSARLQQALDETERRRQECGRLQGLLDERDAQIARARREAATKSQQLELLRVQGRKTEARSKAWVTEVRDRAQEASRLHEKLRRAEEEVRKLRGNNAGLAQEVDMLRKQLEAERKEEAVVTLAEHQALVQRLRAELEAERQKHARSRTALDLLRRHYISRPDQPGRRQIDRITYM
uniref:Coiled-coil domain containing 160 n=1 Tax=Scleropages formosus TaxID=113540 RepID=A0A8C9TMN3_SCLFO